ncbi:hypothetical protein PUN28_000091 [Cardiocondyla obscurior]|uniref:Uncharacterized protein n=1 Tax=Cardiocondyla obscurior TaxID=286306 RepID=A0AAW2GXU3_9HYME
MCLVISSLASSAFRETERAVRPRQHRWSSRRVISTCHMSFSFFFFNLTVLNVKSS